MKTEMKTNPENNSPDCTTLYKLGGAAALVMVAIIIIQFVVFMTAPPPLEGTAVDWFRLFHTCGIIGLVNFELLMVVYVIVSIPMSLALYMALRKANPSLTALFLALSMVGGMAFIAARPAFEMLYLSNGYAAAATESEKSMFLAAGQAILAAFHGTHFHLSYILGSLTGLIISWVMLKSSIFSKRTAYVRIASSVFDFGLYIPAIGLYISIFSVLFLLIWNLMVARRLFQLGQKSQAVAIDLARSEPVTA